MKAILYALIFILYLPIGCSTSPQQDASQPTPTSSITVNGTNYANLTPAEMDAKLTALTEQLLAKNMTLVHNETRWEIPLKELGVTTNQQEILANIAAHQHTQDQAYRLEYRLDEAKAMAKVQNLTSSVNIPARDAVLQVKPDNKAEVIPHVVGAEVDVAQTVAGLKKGLAESSSEVPVAVKALKPKITAEALASKKFDGPIVTFATTFSPSDRNRSDNLKKAAQALDGVMLQPGEVLSFNAIVGPRTEETGYKEAPVIEENELVPGIGGGVCQVSSTLYNLALLADLEMVERHHHEFAVRYLPPGRDATVVYDHADLRFKNNTQAVLLIRTATKGTSLKMTLYGKKSNKHVEIQTVIESTKPFVTERRLDTSLPPGSVDKSKLGMPGYTVKTYRLVKVNNKLVKREELHKDIYKPAKRIIKVGPSTGRGTVP